jgi:hypothetical protein
MNKRTRGTGLTEYIIVVALIAIAAIGVITLYGANVRGLVGNSGTSLAGVVDEPTRTTTYGGGKKTLKTFASADVDQCAAGVCPAP